MKVKLVGFKRSGKYYSDFEVEVPPGTEDYNLRTFVRQAIVSQGLPQDLIYHGETSNGVPFLVL